MSEAEYNKLMNGETLTNFKNHHETDGKKSTSVGFCFFAEQPNEAIHWLRGIVDTD